MNLIIRRQDLFENPTPRLPICLALDNSSHMSGEPIKELVLGLNSFFEYILSDEIAQHSAEIAIVTFGNEINNVMPFRNIKNQKIPMLQSSGLALMGKGVILSYHMS